MSDNQGLTFFLDDEEVGFTRGESIFQVSERHQKEIPTLCYDERLEAFGACRLCIVELEGARTPVASCTTQAEPGMRVTSKSGRPEMHRRELREVVVSETRQGGGDQGGGVSGGCFCPPAAGLGSPREKNSGPSTARNTSWSSP